MAGRYFHWLCIFLMLSAECLHAGDPIESDIPPSDPIVTQVPKIEPTWSCLGIVWPYTGDTNRNAKVLVQFRRVGSETWRPALDLLRKSRNAKNFAGSIFRLAPGTDYEVKLKVIDPDGGSADTTVRARTKEYSRFPKKQVSAAKDKGLDGAEAMAEPGVVVMLEAGEYPAFHFKKSGKPEAPIVYFANGDVTIKGDGLISAQHVWFHGIQFEGDKRVINGKKESGDIRFTNCKFHGHYCIHLPTGAADYFISDNEFKGDANGEFHFGGEGVDFGKGAGECRHAVCFNRFTDTADAVSYGRGNIDVYNNFVHEVSDDFFEPDSSFENYRIWENVCFNSMCGISFQPITSGPWYIFHNQITGNYLHPFKVKEVYGPAVIYGNTILSKKARVANASALMRGLVANNLWMRATKSVLGDGSNVRYDASTSVTNNGYAAQGSKAWSFAFSVGGDSARVEVGIDEVLAEKIAIPEGQPGYGIVKSGEKLPLDWRFPHQLLRIKPDCKLVDAGAKFDNLTGPYLGAQPDIGAFETGLGAPWTGPRVWDRDAQLVYALPEEWRKRPVSDQALFKALGCPDAPHARVLLARDDQKCFALFVLSEAPADTIWKKQEEWIENQGGAETPVLTFQDGFSVRRCKRNGAVLLVASRVEPDGVLEVHVGCSEADWDSHQTELWRLVRALVR